MSGAAMIIRGTCGSVNDGRDRMAPGGYCFADVHSLEKIRRELTIIKQRGAKAEFELCHVGQYATNPKDGYAIGPVSLIREDGTEVRAMDTGMMEYVVERFVSAALDAKNFGFDAILLHFSHGWLPTQFMSPYFNKRTDEYGGSFENRIRFPKMIVEAVRKALGPDFPLDMRISGEEHVPGGMHIEEVAAFIHEVEDHLDMVHISCGIERIKSGIVHMSTSPFVGHMCNAALSEFVRKAVKIPVAVVGAIMTPEEGEQIIASGKADAVVIGR
ncbi:MAG: hypothetical protein LBJ31_05205 [Treponema sp.]|nr:hypothetical protein [Treponema sp.]